MDKLNFYEFIGIMIGDGCLLHYPKHGIYGIEITGNAEEEQDYYFRIVDFLKKTFNVTPRVFVKKQKVGKCLKLVLYNKNLAETLLTAGIKNNKTYNVKIKDEFLSWDIVRYIIKGIFETDGSLFFSKLKNNRYPSYPRLTIKTASLDLAKQILSSLKSKSFKVNIYKDQNIYVIYLSGPKMLEKWLLEIGFSSDKNITKYKLWKKLGYYVPYTSLTERKQLLLA